ncbi:probable methyltransferase-like protein 24 isoform X1 [Castor canadensis]|uniref:Probable methyltransferase-like protein 24 isoform X1 n=1 Tax=Castor canadensis TaxID=51338 RepID=A0AC58MUG0_CASCN
MARERPPGRSCGALPRWLLGAALLLGLRLCVELRRAGSGPPAHSAPPGPRTPWPPGPHLPPAPGPPRGASRRQVTYVRSGRRAPRTSCCAPRGRPRPKGPQWRIQLQPWAGPAQSLEEEASRFLRYIRTIQIACNHVSTDSLSKDSSPAQKPWLVCLDDRFGLAHQIRNKQCRLYSLGLGSDDTHFEVSMANDGCEVHRFDPSVKSAHVLESQRLWHHRLSIDWRDPHPAVAALKPHSNTRKLGSILNEFGHHKARTGAFLRRRIDTRSSYTKERQYGKVADCKPRKEASRESNPADALILDFQPSELLMFSRQIWKVQNGKFWKTLLWKMSLNKLDSSSLRSISTGRGLKSVAVITVSCGSGTASSKSWSRGTSGFSTVIKIYQNLSNS